MNKEIKQFTKWLEEEDHQNWEIERYVEALLKEERQRIIEEMNKLDKGVDADTEEHKILVRVVDIIKKL